MSGRITGLLTGLFVAFLLAAPLAAGAQPATRIPRIGFLSSTSSADSPTTRAFREGMQALGYVEGQNLVVEWRWAAGRSERFPAFAAEMVRLKVDVIVAANDAAGRAAQQATRTIPIVIPTIGDPVGTGFAATLSRPGGNVTGLTMQGPDSTAKRFQLFREALPAVTRVATLADTNDQSYRQVLRELEPSARALGVHVRAHEVSRPGELSGAFDAISREGAQAVFTVGGTMFYANRTQLAELALRHRLPMLCQFREAVMVGCLMSYSASLTDRFRGAARFVDRILKGARPGEIPIEQPTTFELVINARTAKALALTIPTTLLQRADQVIETGQ